MEERIEKTADYVRNYLFDMAEKRSGPYVDPDYRWQHTLRVTQIGKQIAEEEGANVEQVLIACLLHDMAHFDDDANYRDHGRLAARICRPFLSQLGYSGEEMEAICYAVAAHVDGEADFKHPPTLEAAVVTDADNIDRFSAYRILLFCQPEVYDFKGLVKKLEERLAVLRDYRGKRMMETLTGHHLFNEKLDRQIEFYEAILAQNEITVLPEIISAVK
ncbi:MAG TPA: HD domain-containing protein [Anaerolineales bacterium]|nr:HD domain-containing protein [Anaerolineales bacterium]